jgi:D-aspartate ligase
MLSESHKNMDRRYKALIYPSNSVSGYSCIYSLGSIGVPVVALSEWDTPNFKSRYLKEKHIVPYPVKDHEAFVDWLIDYGKKQPSKSVLIMEEDVYAYIASLYQEELKPYYFYPYIPIEKLDIFFNKKTMFEYAAKTSIHLPQALFSPLTKEQINSWQKFPAVLKPQVSRFTFQGRTLVDAIKFPTLFGGKAVWAENSDQLRDLIKRLNDEKIEYCLQQWVPGKDDQLATIMFVAKDGAIPSCFVGPKFRQYPPDFGTNCVGTSKYIPELHHYAEEFCRLTNYSGPAAMEFKRHEKDGRWYLMEINARLPMSMRRATLCGVNMALQLYLMSSGQNMFVKRQDETGKFFIDVMNDVKGMAYRQQFPQWRLTFKEMIRPYLNFEDVVFNWKDPLPGLIRLKGLYKHLWALLKVQIITLFSKRT